MNWVGGARSRVKMKDEHTKQKEFFEKKRYQNKVRRLEKPASPKKRKLPQSTDLLSLQAANYSAKKFSKNDSSSPISRGKVTRVDLNQSRSSLLPFHRLDDIELPMSPGAPSKLLLQDADSSMKQECANITSTKEMGIPPPLNTQKVEIDVKNIIEKEQLTKQSGITSSSQHHQSQVLLRTTRQQEIFPQKFLSQTIPSNTRHQPETKPFPAAPRLKVSSQHSFLINEKTPGPEWQSFDRAPENLFFQFLPSVTSTVKIPSCSDEADIEIIEGSNESPISYKSDISCAGSSQTTVNSKDEEDLLVPQTNPSSPATSVSSLWEAGSISSVDYFSSDNIDNRDKQSRTATRDKDHGPWSSAGEDAPHLSDSSLTTFRQYHRKLLNRHISRPFQDPQHMISKHPTHAPRTPTIQQQREKVDLICREPLGFISPIQHTLHKKVVTAPPTSRRAMNEIHDETLAHTENNHLMPCYVGHGQSTTISISSSKGVSTCTAKPSQEDVNMIVSTKTSMNANDNQLMDSSERNFTQSSMSAFQRVPTTSVTSSEEEGVNLVVSPETIDRVTGNTEGKHLQETSLATTLTQAVVNKADGKRTPDGLAVDWKAFIGGVVEEDVELIVSSKSEDSSQVSCDEIDDDRQQVTNQVLLEVMALDKKINESILCSPTDEIKKSSTHTPWPDKMQPKEQVDCLEVFSETDNSQELDSQESQVNQCHPEKSRESSSTEEIPQGKHCKEESRKSQRSSFKRHVICQPKEELKVTTGKKMQDGSSSSSAPSSCDSLPVGYNTECSAKLKVGPSEQHHNIGQRKNLTSDENNCGMSSVKESSVVTSSSAFAKEEAIRSQSTQTVFKNFIEQTNAGLLENCLDNERQTKGIDCNKEAVQKGNPYRAAGTDVGTQCSFIKTTDRGIQCQLLTLNSDKKGCEKCQNLLAQAKQGETSQENTENQCLAPVHRQDIEVVSLGIQCDKFLVESPQMDKRHVVRVAGGRINNREHKAYGPLDMEGNDKCCMS